MKMTSMARMGSSGNTKLLSKYGGKHKERPYKFANGGAVPGGASPKAYADGGPIDGMPARARMDRKGPKGKDKKGGKTTVNVVVAGKGADGAGPPPMPMPPPGAAGPPMPPPGPGMPMRKDGGRIANLGKYAHGGRVKKADGGTVNKYAKGGRIHMTAGACSGEGREEKAEAVERRYGRK